jgi:hypothetical protein
MNFLMTTYVYPLAERVPLSEMLNVHLDNPRTEEEVEAVAEYIERAYSVGSAWRLPPHTEENFVSLEGLISRFCNSVADSNSYMAEFCASYERDKLFEFMARMWVVARYDDESQIEVERERLREHRERGEMVVALYDEDHPILRNSRRLAEYSYLLSLLVHTQENEYMGQSFILDSDASQFGSEEPNTKLGMHFLTFSLLQLQYPDGPAYPRERWQLLPAIEQELRDKAQLLDSALNGGHEERLMYVAGLLKAVGEDISDDRFKLVVLVSIVELLLTHSPDYNRFNVEDSISKQFRLKAGLLIYLNDRGRDLGQIKERLRTIYGIRSNISHGNFASVSGYVEGLSRREGQEGYFSDLISDLYTYIRAILEELLKDPDLVKFLKDN